MTDGPRHRYECECGETGEWTDDATAASRALVIHWEDAGCDRDGQITVEWPTIVVGEAAVEKLNDAPPV